jgi:hypothetical protein
MDHYFDLGPYHRPITSRSAEAQVWFDRGLNWCYAFHREEALRCFGNVTEQQLAASQAIADAPVKTSCFYRQPDSCCDLGG